MWPGGTTKIPQDTLRLDPPNISIGWIPETAWGTPTLQQDSRVYAQQAIDEINADLFILPNTHLTLEVDERVHNNNLTVKAFNAIATRAKAAGRPLASLMAISSTHMQTIYAPHNNVTVTQPTTGVPIVGYYTGASFLSDSKKFPNFVRLYPPVSEVFAVVKKMAVRIIYVIRQENVADEYCLLYSSPQKIAPLLLPNTHRFTRIFIFLACSFHSYVGLCLTIRSARRSSISAGRM